MTEKLPREFELIDHLAYRLAGYLRQLTGYTYSRREEFYQYQATLRVPATGTSTTVAAGAVQTTTLQISQEADFIATNMSAAIEILSVLTTTNTSEGAIVAAISPTVAAGGGSGNAIGPTLAPPPIDYIIKIGSSDRQLSNQEINAYAGIGIGMFPRTFPKPRLFGANSSVLLNIRPRFAISVGAYNIFFCFTGYKKFHEEGLNLTRRA